MFKNFDPTRLSTVYVHEFDEKGYRVGIHTLLVDFRCLGDEDDLDDEIQVKLSLALLPEYEPVRFTKHADISLFVDDDPDSSTYGSYVTSARRGVIRHKSKFFKVELYEECPEGRRFVDSLDYADFSRYELRELKNWIFDSIEWFFDGDVSYVDTDILDRKIEIVCLPGVEVLSKTPPTPPLGSRV